MVEPDHRDHGIGLCDGFPFSEGKLRTLNEFHIILLPESLQAGIRCDIAAGDGVHSAGTAAVGHGVGIGAQDDDAAFLHGQQAVIDKKHGRLHRGVIGHFPGVLVILRDGLILRRKVQEAVGNECLEDVPAHLVEVCLRDNPVLDEGLHHLRLGREVLRHLKVQSAGKHAQRRVGRFPVGHDDAVEAPGAEILLYKPGILCRVDFVHGVVASHDGSHIALLHRLAESREIDLVQSPLIGHGTDAVSLVLLVVEGKMLDGSHHPVLLDAPDVVESDLGGEIRILSVVLEITSAQGRTVDVHSRAEHDPHTTGGGVETDAVAHPFRRLAVKTGGQADPAGIVCTVRLVTYALRAVGHSY